MMPLNDITAHLSGPELVCALFGVGIALGLLTGLFGVGGGFAIVPLLKVVFGIDDSLAVGSSLSFMVGTSATGFARHLKLGNAHRRAVVCLASGSIIGVMGGHSMHEWLRDSLADGDVDKFKTTMNILFIVLLLGTAILMRKERPEDHTRLAPLQRMRIGPFMSLPRYEIPRISISGMILTGVGIGVLTGALGVGGGVLLVPLLITVVGMSVHQAIATSLGVVFFAAFAGTIRYGVDGRVSLWIAISLLTGSVIGVRMGVSLCQRLNAHRLKKYFTLLVLAVAAMLAVDVAVRYFGS